jgi:hypothetical protein
VNKTLGGSDILLGLGLTSTSVLNVTVEGNELRGGTEQGILVAGPKSSMAFVTGVDLGSPGGSLGGNDFRAFATTATAKSGAIVLQNITPSQGVVTAQRNIFATGITPATVVFPASQIDTANSLTGNAAFVQTLYINLLERAGDTANSNDAGGWVHLLDTAAITPQQAANSIGRSAEALGLIVDGLYLKLLNRAADHSGRAAFIAFLQAGGTVEQGIVSLVTSDEYANVAGSPGSFVQSLYSRLLGRFGDADEVAAGINALATLGRAGVARIFVQSAEFRTNVVQELYGFTSAPLLSVPSNLPNLLHRPSPPSASEVAAAVNSSLDMLTLKLFFAGSPEFYVNG